VTVPLFADNPTSSDPYFHTLSAEEDGLLPAARFSPRTLLGAGSSEREVMGQLFASQIAHAITTKNAEEARPLLLGLGLAKVADSEDREWFLEVIDLVLKVL
jgi:proteasome assembly chaperone 3